MVVVANAGAGAWALGAQYREQLRRPQLWWLAGFAHLSVFAQVAVGVSLISGDITDGLRIHMFYGFVAAFTVAAVFSYRGQLRDKVYLLYGWGGLFLAGLALRAITLDPY